MSRPGRDSQALSTAGPSERTALKSPPGSHLSQFQKQAKSNGTSHDGAVVLRVGGGQDLGTMPSTGANRATETHVRAAEVSARKRSLAHIPPIHPASAGISHTLQGRR